MESRRSWVRRVIHAAILVVVGYGIEKGLEEVLPDELPTIHGTGNETLGPLTSVATGVVGAEGYAAGHATVCGVSA